MLGMMPQVGMLKDLKNVKVDEKEITRVVAIIDSMTPHERANHMIINGSRRRRIAKGSGHQRAGSQPAAEAVRAGAQDDEELLRRISGQEAGQDEVAVHFKIEDSESWRVSMLMIRLARFGAKKKPFYRVVVIEKEKARDGRNVEVVGHYNPRTTPAKVDLKHERIAHWMKNGAQLSDTVARLVKKNPAPAAQPAA